MAQLTRPRTLSTLFRPLGALALMLALASPALADMQLQAPELSPGGRLPPAQVYQGFGCEGGNQSPALHWNGAPQGTRSFALTVYDPDAPTGSGWWHWIVYDLPASTQQLPADAGKASAPQLPTGARMGPNDYGSASFGGACPPPGDKPHRYIFTLHALDVEQLALPAKPSAALIGYMIKAHSLGEARLEALYSR
ncbi:MAG: YbhB/YbcL family Raf kinase inhibitor-like protein [Rhodocyclales bacterium]|nr:YbhB/YbcL family Raf kinase inhibitor-like protein [Rhodocyclales bacterium]